MTIDVFSTCPPPGAAGGAGYLERVAEVARWSEEHGCRGILVYTDNSLPDPWLVAHWIVQSTRALAPLVAVQPVYEHPYTVAKRVATLGSLYRRRIFLNLVAGGFKGDLEALGDATPHDRRYDRLVEYAEIVLGLCRPGGAVALAGEFYSVAGLTLRPELPAELAPGLFVSGSSTAGLAAARRLGATAVQYPEPPGSLTRAEPGLGLGIRIGIIARDAEDEAWEVAHRRFPEDRRGQLTHELAMKVSDSAWHRRLSELGGREAGERDPYWLVPFRNYKSFCPYLVGSTERVAAELERYFAAGFRSIILDVPPDPAELTWAFEAIQGAGVTAGGG